MTQDFQSALNSPEMQKVLPYLLAGGAGAVAGGVASGGRQRKETRGSHIARVLRNALLTGGLAAGGTYAVRKGLEKTVGNMDAKGPGTGSPGNEGPLTTSIKGIAFSPITAGAAGIGGLAATAGSKGFLGAGDDNRKSALGEFSKATGQSEANLKNVRTAKDIATMTAKGAPGLSPAELNKLRQAAGLSSEYSEAGSALSRIDPTLKGILSKVTRSGPASLLGQTTGKRIGRGALGLTAAAIPALIGALATSDPNAK